MRYIPTAAAWIATSLAAILFAPMQAGAAASSELYRCKDGKGQTHFSDSMPAACEGFDTDVVGPNGAILRTIEGTSTRIAREQRAGAEAKAREDQQKRELRDRMLIDTYLSVDDIERLRDQRLELLVSQYRVTELSMRNLRERQTRLESQIARFKPYSSSPAAPPLPDHLAEEMVNMVNSLKVYEETLVKNRAEQADVTSSFASDIKRFRELRGIK